MHAPPFRLEMARSFGCLLAAILGAHGIATGQGPAARGNDYPIAPVPFTQVSVDDAFWSPRLETNRRVTIPYDFEKCEETGRISNFARAGGLEPGGFEGIYYNDSDVYKVIEGAAYSLSLHPDAKLDRYLDDLIAKIAAAQEEDGYLYTARTLRPDDPPAGSGPTRWSNLAHSHELYNVGHLYEAAVAHWQATGKRSLLDVALRNSALVDSVFGPGKRRDVPGHQEIEIGLVKLYRATGDERWLRLARFFLDQRGRPDGHALYGSYAQDHEPVVDQSEAVGHAVRAVYLYCGMADVASLTGDRALVRAIDRIWDDVVTRKTYLTGGIGARRGGEAFGAAFELPARTAYNETCAAIGNALWNHRMFLLHGDAKYIDVVERVIHNGFLAGVSQQGDRFFYPNPLSCDGKTPFNQGAATRQPWFACSCCPVNVVRFVPAIAGFLYAVRDRSVYVNLFVGGKVTANVGDAAVRLTQKTGMPWRGDVEVDVDVDAPLDFELRVRIPGWARGEPLPGGLYRYLDEDRSEPRLAVNGEAVPLQLENGYAVLARRWQRGDRVTLDLPLPVRRVVARDEVADARGRVAIVRGPLAYRVEAADHGGRALDLVLPDDAALEFVDRPELLGGVQIVTANGLRAKRGDDGAVRGEPAAITAIPYYAWCHRGAGEMTVWLPRGIENADVGRAPTIASRATSTASHCWGSDSVEALNDQQEPSSSGDHGIPRLTWWDHRGGSEWVQYDFTAIETVSSVAVYWFDDTGRGACRVPARWRVLYRDPALGEDAEWKEVQPRGGYGVAADRFNEVTFEPVRARALRLEVELQGDWSGGILEWKVR